MVSKDIQKYFQKIGKKGGKNRAKALHAKERSSQAKRAVLTRWMKKRFGVESFEKLGVPGAQIIDFGLRDLVNTKFYTPNALVVLELCPRLKFLNVPVPNLSKPISNVRGRLFQKMKKQHGDMAYVRFCGLLERANSFCETLAQLFPIPKESPHKNRRWFA